ncbi:MAG: DUF3656 domain-containing protein, partial [Muribaculaceae bacterium]|nr:DUF3656 domain-containing protein [Muribaculaceae bacterium]
ISSHKDTFRRLSFGTSDVSFDPELSKSFNRGFTHYFIDQRRPKGIISPDTPKSLGEVIDDVSKLRNGDGISFFDKNGCYTGAMVNGIKGQRIITSRPIEIPKGAEIHRTFDRLMDKQLQRATAQRKIGVSFTLDDTGLSATDERGCQIRIPLDCKRDVAKRPQELYPILSRLGNTPYRLDSFHSELDSSVFIPATGLTELRRNAVEALNKSNESTYPYHYRRKEDKAAQYMTETLDYRDNVANSLAETFYRDHGVKMIERALETSGRGVSKEQRMMTTRHCILRELGMCKKEKGSGKYTEPLMLQSGKLKFKLEFNCRDCEMHLVGMR